ncbi:hypothetical protein NIES4072_29360 [Nostoc commune NIES-4072]|uniref:DUF5615 domain-containing protein n=1 Tax=Nostoc commune NIES-4072 TaxID=2005467 RepID=A0A2R5FML6_NOSCO|nr:hypothetical protein NIES4070_61390 [Nostoc commune HK-02]GBG19269.1 hypothetical protein NIES4072_29360 [Nostoc commune NIES-4072]
MVRFYADEQFPFPVVQLLRALGHDVLTVQEAENADQGIPDEEVLAFAIIGLTHTLRILGALGVLAVREIKLFSNFCVSPT